MKNNQMISFDEMIKSCFIDKDVYIPLIQRNYKWDSKTAAKLATDLWRSFNHNLETYTIGMITLHEESNKKLQLIDGQQRIITLYMLLKYLMPNDEAFAFRFERDEGIDYGNCTRVSYLNQIANPQIPESGMYTDLNRFAVNYAAIVKALTDVREDNSDNLNQYAYYTDKYAAEFAKYIKTHVYFLLHISDAEPFDEFINLNKNKTRFVISDRIKANLIIDSGEAEQRDIVLKLFGDLSKKFFSNRKIWGLVKQGYEEEKPLKDEERIKYKHYLDENRLKLLCCERYGSDKHDSNSILGYNYSQELAVLKKYLTILDVLESDLEADNWNSFNGFNCLFRLDNIVNKDVNKNNDQNALRFFQMLNKPGEMHLEEFLFDRWSNLKEVFEKTCFIESQLYNMEKPLDYVDNLLEIRAEFNEKEQENWLCNGSEEFENFQQVYAEYIKDKYKVEVK